MRQPSTWVEWFLPAQPGGLTTSGRPLVHATLVANFALSGEAVWSYHAVNLAIHLCAGLVLFGLVRRTLELTWRPHGAPRDALPLAAAAAALWLLHPLQTAAVTYIVQRAEALAGLFYVLTLYAFVRSVAAIEPPSAARWRRTAIATSALAMASKEVAASLPLIVLLFDRTFAAGSFAAAWRQRRGFYLGLAATWLLLLVLVLGTGGRGGTAGFGSEVSVWSYALTQAQAIWHYLRLSLWPSPLVFDYGGRTVQTLAEVAVPAAGIVALIAATAWALVSRRVAGFLAVAFFAILAPSSSIVPIVTQTMAEHRMYLALAPVLVGLVGLGASVLRGWAPAFWGAAAIALGAATFVRNQDYRSAIALWEDTAAKQPANARAHNNLGEVLFRAGRVEESAASYRRALALQPRYPEPHYNLGVALAALGDLDGAVRHYTAALAEAPDYPQALNNLGNALVRLGRRDEAIARYEEAIRRRPDFPEAHNNLGNALLESGRVEAALAAFHRAVQLRPRDAEAQFHLGNALAARGDMPEALAAFREAVRLRPTFAAALVNTGNALLALGRPSEAVAAFEQALTIDPALVDAHFNLGSALLDQQRWRDAAARFETVLRLQPEFGAAERTLGFALFQLGRTDEAVARYRRYLERRPEDSEARAELAEILRR